MTKRDTVGTLSCIVDAATEALGMVAANGRMVVLISHVRAVAEQVPDVEVA